MGIGIGVIGYGVRIDMLMDQLRDCYGDAKVVAVADPGPVRVKELMRKDGDKKLQHELEIDKIDGLLRKCRMDPDEIRFYETAEEMLSKEALDGVMVGICEEDIESLCKWEGKEKVPTVVSFPLRTTALIRETRRLISEGVIGKIDHVQAYNDVGYGFVYFHDWYRDEGKAHGLFLQKATHDIDVINYLTGEKPVQVCAMKSKQIFRGDMPSGLRCSQCDRMRDCMESTYHIERTRNDIPRGTTAAMQKIPEMRTAGA